MKCGTTAWYEYLRSHPDIFMPDLKEPGFFALDLPNWRGIQSEEEYAALFADSGSAKMLGEASGIYLVSDTAAQAIREFNPAAKILIFLRDQEQYLPSLHNLNLLEFAENIRDFEMAWRLSGRRPPKTIPASVEPRVLDYVAMGRFHEQVARYLDQFPADQVRVFWFRDWVGDPRATYLMILDFLNLADDGRTDFPPVNPGVTFRSRAFAGLIIQPSPLARRVAQLLKRLTGPFGRFLDRTAKEMGILTMPGYKKEISPQLRDEIRRYYAEDNKTLEERLRRDSPGGSSTLQSTCLNRPS
jgi:hypothetical protein